MNPPFIDYDGQSRAAYVALVSKHDGPPTTIAVTERFQLDVMADGRIMGVEILNCDIEDLAQIPLLALVAISLYYATLAK